MRGAGKRGFDKIINDLRKLGNFDGLAILEPRVSGDKVAKIIDRLGFNKKFIVETSGFSGDIWLLWNDNRVNLQVVASSKHTITAVVVEGNNYWVVTFVYASPSAMFIRKLWVYLKALRNCFKGPWVVMGDFNEIVNSSKKRGVRPRGT